MIHDAIFAGIGFVAGAFCPGVLRAIKAFFVKEAPIIEADVKKKL